MTTRANAGATPVTLAAAIDAIAGAAGIVDRDYAFDLAGNTTGVADNAGTMSWGARVDTAGAAISSNSNTEYSGI